MRHVLLTLLTLSLLVFGATPVRANHQGGHYWDLRVSQPDSPTNEGVIVISFTTLSTDQDDELAVSGSVRNQDTDEEASLGTQNVGAGDSGDFEFTVEHDGSYRFTLTALNGAESQQDSVDVVVNTVPPQAPDYQGQERNGNDFTIAFATADDDQTRGVRIYSSTASSFTADESTLVGIVSINDGESGEFTYNAPNDTPRFFAMQSFDSAGNVSELVGDEEAIVVQRQAPDNPASVGGSDATVTAQGTGDIADVQGATDNGDNDGTTANEGTEGTDGEVLAAETEDKAGGTLSRPLALGLGALGLLGLAGYMWRRRHLGEE